MRYVIVGSSFAGLFAAEAIRRADPEGEIAMVSRELSPPYSRAMIHEYLSGLADERLMLLRRDDYFRNHRIAFFPGAEATGLDAQERRLLLGEKRMPYDRLLIATGGAPFVPPGIEGIEGARGVFTFTERRDAEQMRDALAEVERVVVLGAGLIGLQCAEGLAHMGKRVSVVELADSILPAALDADAASLVAAELARQGIDIATSETLSSVECDDEGGIRAATLRSGRRIPCGMLVVAIGVRPNVEVFRDSGLVIDRGIVVDDRMRTNLPDVYAAGDCAQGREIITGKRMPVPIIPVASTMGMIAGYNMAGADRAYVGALPMNALQFGELQVMSFGFPREEDGAEIFRVLDPAARVYRKAVVRDDRLVGVLLVRSIERAGLYRHLIENGVDVGSFKERLVSDDFGPALFPRAVRDAMFTVNQ